VQVAAGGTAEDIAVLKNSANERLIFVFNATDNKRSFELKNKLLPVNSTCFDYYTGEQFNNPDNLQVTVPPQDVKVIIIKK
jgi:hypothetical protein